jgi:hypothetical protein
LPTSSSEIQQLRKPIVLTARGNLFILPASTGAGRPGFLSRESNSELALFPTRLLTNVSNGYRHRTSPGKPFDAALTVHIRKLMLSTTCRA